MTNYRKLSNQPLCFALAEFRFSSVMDIQSYIPKIQDALREEYPVLETSAEQSVQLQPGGVAVSRVEQWMFLSANRKSAVVINQDRLIHCTSEYSRFPGFSSNCQKALEVLVELVKPGLILRIGLRYGDLVRIDDGETAADLVDPDFIYPGSASALGEPLHKKSETYIATEHGRLAIRSLYGIHNLTYMPDVQNLPLAIAADEKASERVVLDFDHFWEAGQASTVFNCQDIISKLDSLHEISREAFWKVTTDKARNEKWN